MLVKQSEKSVFNDLKHVCIFSQPWVLEKLARCCRIFQILVEISIYEIKTLSDVEMRPIDTN